MVTNDWSELFIIRRRGNEYYISMKNGPYPVQGTPNFEYWIEAKEFLKHNWRKLYDEEFERQVLIGSEHSETDNESESSSST